MKKIFIPAPRFRVATALALTLALTPFLSLWNVSEAKPPRHAPAYGYRRKQDDRRNDKRRYDRRDNDRNRYDRRDNDRNRYDRNRYDRNRYDRNRYDRNRRDSNPRYDRTNTNLGNIGSYFRR